MLCHSQIDHLIHELLLFRVCHLEHLFPRRMVGVTLAAAAAAGGAVATIVVVVVAAGVECNQVFGGF